MRMRSKLWLLAGVAVSGAVALYGATQVWVTLLLADGAAAFDRLEVTGQQLNQSLSPIALAALAAALALTIAGPAFRRVLGVLVALLGAGVAAIASAALGDAPAAVAGRLAEATGIAGSSSQHLVTGSETSPLIIVTLAAGIALVLLGLLVLLLSGRWKAAGRKYESEAGHEPRAHLASAEPDRISDWEAMNDGEDPSDDAGDGDTTDNR